MRLGKLIGLFLAAVLCIGIIPVNAFAAGGSGSLENFAEKTTWKDDLFRDVTETDWFYDNVRAVYESGLMVGKGDGVFDPSGNVTVAEILTVAARLNAIYTTGSDDFEKTEPWYAGYAAYCLEQGIVTGLPDDMNAPAARGFVAAVLAAAIPEEEFDAKNTVSDGAIPDVSLEDPFGPAVYLLYRAGIVIGNDGEGRFAPFSDVKRCETAAILTRIIDKSLRMNVTLGAADTAAKESTDEGKGSAEQKTSDFRLPFFNLKSWEEAIRDHTGRPVIPQKPDDPDKPEKPDEPKDPTDELTAAYNRLVEEQSNFRLRLRREVNPGTYTYRWYEDEFEHDGDITHFCEQNIYRDKTDEYFRRNGSGEIERGVKRTLGEWGAMNSIELLYDAPDFVSFPEGIDSSLYEPIGDGWYQASETARQDEAGRMIAYLSNEEVAGNFTVGDFRIRVTDGRVSAMFAAYSVEERRRTLTCTEVYEFGGFGEVSLTMPEPTQIPEVLGYEFAELLGVGELSDGMKVKFKGFVLGTTDNCCFVDDETGMIPVYIDELGAMYDRRYYMGLIGMVSTGRFRGGIPALVPEDPEHAQADEMYKPNEVTLTGDEIPGLTDSAIGLLNFTCLRVPEIPDEDTLAEQDYTVAVRDAYGNKARFFLGDPSTAVQDPNGYAAQFRKDLRECVGNLLLASGGTECGLDLSSVLLMNAADGPVFAPICETEFQESAGPALSFVPEKVVILNDPETTLEQALSSTQIIQVNGDNTISTPVLELGPSCPDFDAGTPGSYTVTMTYKKIDLTYEIRVMGGDEGVYAEKMDAPTMEEMDIIPSASIPSTGDVSILVIPIRFADSPDYNVDLEKAFNSTDHSTGWYSLKEYYREVSYGALNLNAVICDPYVIEQDAETVKKSSSLYNMAGDIGELALAYYDPVIDYTDYDQNHDGQLDCVYLVYDYPLENPNSDWWCYYGLSTSNRTYDGLEYGGYLWVSAQSFMQDFYNTKNDEFAGIGDGELNCRLLIHETGHALGLPDLYGTVTNPTGDTVMMCANLGDHDPLSKAVLGWITPSFDYASPRTIRLSSYTKTGCALIVSPDEEQSYFKDSYIVMLYEPTGVNEKFSDKDMGLFSKPGIVIYRVSAKLANRILSPLYCYKYNNANAFGTMENALIRLIQNNGRDTLGNDMWARANDEDLFLEGDSYTFTWPDDFGAPSMTVTVDGIEQDGDGSWYANITLK